MSLTITDPITLATLAAAVGPELPVHGPDGRLLGRFTPAPRPGMMYPEFGMTDEEIERFDNNPDAVWVTAADVTARLDSLRGIA
jgi:hypothetical protein